MDLATLVESTDALHGNGGKCSSQRELEWFLVIHQIRANYWHAANNVAYDFRGSKANNLPEMNQVDQVLNLLSTTEAMRDDLFRELGRACRLPKYRQEIERQIRDAATSDMNNVEIYELGHRLVLKNLSPIIEKVRETLDAFYYHQVYDPTKISYNDLPDNVYMKQFRRLFREPSLMAPMY